MLHSDRDAVTNRIMSRVCSDFDEGMTEIVEELASPENGLAPLTDKGVIKFLFMIGALTLAGSIDVVPGIEIVRNHLRQKVMNTAIEAVGIKKIEELGYKIGSQ